MEFDAAPCSESADQAVSNEGRMEARALDEAKDFLAEILKDGPKPATEIFEMAEGEGISLTTLRWASKAIQIKRWRSGMAGKFIWSLSGEGSPEA